MHLNNRELASLIWGVILLFWFLTKRGIRSAIFKTLQAFIAWKIILMFLLALVYVSVLCHIFSLFGYWSIADLKELIFWFIGTGGILLLSLSRAQKERLFFRKLLVDSLKLVVVVEYIVNSYTFPLLLELVMLPILTILVLMNGMSERDEGAAKAKSPVASLVMLIVLTILVVSIFDVISNYSVNKAVEHLKAISLPIVFSISFLPFLYGMALVMAYEVLFVRVGLYIDNQSDLRYSKRLIIRYCKFSLSRLRNIPSKVNSLYRGCSREHIDKLFE